MFIRVLPIDTENAGKPSHTYRTPHPAITETSSPFHPGVKSGGIKNASGVEEKTRVLRHRDG